MQELPQHVGMTVDQKLAVKNMLDGLSPLGDPIKQNKTDLNEMEVAKVAIGVMLDKEHLNSTTNLEEELIYDLAEFTALNTFYNCYPGEIYARELKEMKRSESENPVSLLQVISDMVSRSLPTQQQPKGLWDRFRH